MYMYIFVIVLGQEKKTAYTIHNKPSSKERENKVELLIIAVQLVLPFVLLFFDYVVGMPWPAGCDLAAVLLLL